jgi:predicted DNA-binding WGR domain protein
MDDFEARAMTALHLCRIDPARNMRRFYRLDVQPDLFGRGLLVRQWGRIGTGGRMMVEFFDTEERPCRFAAAGRAQEAARV